MKVTLVYGLLLVGLLGVDLRNDLGGVSDATGAIESDPVDGGSRLGLVGKRSGEKHVVD